MLPDFKKVRQPITDAINMALRNMINSRPLIASVRSEHFFEGHSWAGYGVDVTEGKNEFKRFEMPTSFPTAELIRRGPDIVVSKLPELAAGMADQLERRMLERMKEAAADESNAGIAAGGSVVTPDDWLANLEKMRIDFDRDGKPLMPLAVVTPGLAESISRWDDDPVLRERLAELIKRKREEFDARESNRTLVD